MYFEECVRSIREAFEDREHSDEGRAVLLERACSTFGEMNDAVKASLPQDMLALISRLPLSAIPSGNC